ncbi:hypothetical protein [Seleniivibrio woodruffii]|uniref:Uncharacterized protein n=1 Tax=Seleniivibrio woodruffii TaxID=1078050 RepID=A0A4R1K8J3_9BACT|nr:hypothetical protein [Seleniivibrio woodruffii]TCK60645.1 hypothetical protein C8D98_1524 [Seleniivibrio woodruffii]TVZ36275.1 hypothetical protein OF66_1900 [Seleniivibrio woodruffii]
MPTSWLKETFEKGVEEIQKLAKTGSIKIDITNLKKKRDERVKLIGNKVLEMIRTGELKAETFEPDYSYILEMDKKIELKERELTDGDTAVYHEERPAQTASAQPADPAKEHTQLPAPAAVVRQDNEDDDKDPHEDYINRPG